MRNNESGRSMVEMLGVLAVIGVLSIGGIAGYTYAMNRLKANDIIDGVNKRAVALSTYTLLGTGVSATTLDAEFANKIGDFPVALAAADPGFTLTVSEITRPVCNHVLNNGVQMARTITLGTTKVWENGVKADYTCAEDGNTIVFTFAPAAGEGGNTPTCGYCQHVENGTCVADKTCDNHCPGDKPMKSSSGTCYSCSTAYEIDGVDATECAKCPNRFMTPFGCLLCSAIRGVDADAAECAKCPNRFLSTHGYCYLCSENQRLDADATECAKCPNRFMTTEGECVLCSEIRGYKADAAECAKCPNRFREIDDTCYDCGSDPSDGIIADSSECAKCPNRFLGTTGFCRLCSENWGYGDADAAECAKCPNREMYNEMCTPICSDGEFKNKRGMCFDCSDSVGVYAESSECAKCPNREMKDGKCVLK